MQQFLDRLSRASAEAFYLALPLSWGLYLIGDVHALGKTIPYSAVTLPLSGILIFVLFFSQYQVVKKAFDPQEIIALLLFIIVSLFWALTSFDSMVSISSLMLWVTAFLLLGCRHKLKLESAFSQDLAWTSLLIMALLAIGEPGWINIPVLCLMGIWIWIQTVQHYHNRTFFLKTFLLWGSFWLFDQTAFLVLALLLLFGFNLWNARTNKIFEHWQWVSGLVFLLLLILIQFPWEFWNMQIIQDLGPTLWESGSRMAFGIGDRGFYYYYAGEYQLFLNPELWQFPQSDALVVLFEKGIGGLLLYIVLSFFPVWRNRKNGLLRTFILLFLLVFSRYLWSTPQGIMMLGVLLFL